MGNASNTILRASSIPRFPIQTSDLHPTYFADSPFQWRETHAVELEPLKGACGIAVASNQHYDAGTWS
ncbi:hypothetical protein ANO14919_105630 [Xylariales sp. No.14919]|nr:hypothetical protein ANO14919_105630 [Xylariales sp. No.14919]